MRAYFETERLIVRNLVSQDYEQVFKWCGDPRVNEFMIYPLYKCAEDVKIWIDTLEVDNPNIHDFGWILKDTGELIGGGGVVFHPDIDVWNIGYNLLADKWGNGYTVEAMQGIIEYIKKTRDIHVIEGQFAADNLNSMRVMEKLGMVYDRDGEYEKLDGSRKFASKIYCMKI